MEEKRFKEMLVKAQTDGLTVVQTKGLATYQAASLQGPPALVAKWHKALCEAGAEGMGTPGPHPNNRTIDSCFAKREKSSNQSIAEMVL